MKPTMNICVRISTDSAQTQRYTEKEIEHEFSVNNIDIQKNLIIRKSDGAVMGEMFYAKK